MPLDRTRSPSMHLWQGLVGILGLAAVPTLVGCGQSAPSAEAMIPPAPKVTVARPLEREITDYDVYTGRTDAVEMVEIRPRVSGYLTEIHFQDGEDVEEGDVLFTIDQRPYQAALDEAKAELQRLQARREFAEVEYRRYGRLARQDAGSREDFDRAAAARDEAIAGLAAAEAQLEKARLDFEFTTIQAPISGRIDRTYITVGNLINAGIGQSTSLTTIVSIDPMFVYFDVDERSMLRYQAIVRERGESSRPDFKTARIPVFLGLTSESGYPHEGVLDFAANRVDPSTGTIRARAVFPNENRLLTPGLFARIRLERQEPYQTLLVPERALGTDQGQRFLLVVNDQDEVESRRIEVGTLTDDEYRVIRSGITPTDRVIINGMLRVRPGMTVEVDEEPIPATSTPTGNGEPPA